MTFPFREILLKTNKRLKEEVAALLRPESFATLTQQNPNNSTVFLDAGLDCWLPILFFGCPLTLKGVGIPTTTSWSQSPNQNIPTMGSFWFGIFPDSLFNTLEKGTTEKRMKVMKSSMNMGWLKLSLLRSPNSQRGSNKASDTFPTSTHTPHFFLT